MKHSIDTDAAAPGAGAPATAFILTTDFTMASAVAAAEPAAEPAAAASVLILCFVFGFSIAGRYTIGFVLCTEQVPKNFRVQLGLLINLADAAVILYITIYLKFNQNWVYLQIVGIIVNFVGAIACCMFVQESPVYLLSKGSRNHAFLKFKSREKG